MSQIGAAANSVLNHCYSSDCSDCSSAYWRDFGITAIALTVLTVVPQVGRICKAVVAVVRVDGQTIYFLLLLNFISSFRGVQLQPVVGDLLWPRRLFLILD